ncbi:MAG: hypothetical protein MJ025_03610, partial [Victivallaceae bacterium]|nr:hypothetical protein [Victivallaceae bacterium]
MKKLSCVLVALLCCGLICSAADAPKPETPQGKAPAAAPQAKKLKKRQPKAIGPGKVPVFAYNGGRPWVGHDCMAPIASAGGKLFLFDSVYLAGLGGASIKQHMGDKTEPPARDGFTQSFQKMSEQGPAAARVAVFNYIPIKNMEKIFDDREDAMPAMRAYLEKGGNLLFYGNVPSESKVASLMPVEFEGDAYTSYGDGAHVTRPSGVRFSMFPEKMPAFGSYRPCDTVKGAEVLSWIIEDGAKMSPFIARRKVGKGTVTFINLNLYNPTSPDSYGHWEYARAFTAALVADCGNIDEINPAKCVKSLETIPGRKQVAEAKAVVGDPALDITESASVKVSGDTATFENGCRVVLDRKSGTVDVYVPCVEGKFMSGCGTPEVRLSKKQATIDKNSNEYTGVKDFDVSAKIPWKVADFSVDGNQAVVTFKASGNEMRWYFKAGSWNLDGRTYVGVADKAEVSKSPLLIGGFRFQRSVAVPEPLFARRMSCYSNPRGYADFDLRGKKNAMAGMKKPEKDKISAWSMIGSGQPFELIVFKSGVYLTTLTAPYSVNTSMEVGAQGTPIAVTNSFGVGRVKAPVSSQY